MHDVHHMFQELTVIIAIAVGVSLIMRTLRQPLMIGYILTGVLVGPAIFDIVHSVETIEIFAEFGIALLLFIMGLGLNLHVVKDIGKVAFVASLAQVLFVGGTAYAAASLAGYSATVAMYIAIALSLSSPIMISTEIGFIISTISEKTAVRVGASAMTPRSTSVPSITKCSTMKKSRSGLRRDATSVA